jgi:hypothetical protein
MHGIPIMSSTTAKPIAKRKTAADTAVLVPRLRGKYKVTIGTQITVSCPNGGFNDKFHAAVKRFGGTWVANSKGWIASASDAGKLEVTLQAYEARIAARQQAIADHKKLPRTNLLGIDYERREFARAHGADWDARLKTWYIHGPVPAAFEKVVARPSWLPAPSLSTQYGVQMPEDLVKLLRVGMVIRGPTWRGIPLTAAPMAVVIAWISRRVDADHTVSVIYCPVSPEEEAAMAEREAAKAALAATLIDRGEN